MPNTADYSHFYYLGTTPPDGSTVLAAGQADLNTITDSEDGTADGMTTVGQQLDWSESGLVVNLFGFSAAGDPVVQVMGGATSYYMLSNNSGLTGSNPNIQTSGTFVYCFGAGTQISSADGATCAVETLQIGQMIQTGTGQATPVKWIGRKTVHKLFSGVNMQPVCIKTGALGGGLPTTDLTVTADHGMIVDGFVINASALINGTTIDWVPMDKLPTNVTYYHIETEDHDVILANGAPAETFVDAVTRTGFDNHQEYLDLFGADRLIPEMPMLRISAQRMLPQHIKARLGITTDLAKMDFAKSG